MRLKSVDISNYKNLKDFTISFDKDDFLSVLVGKNGTGKSNLFEALLEIFRHLYEYDSQKSALEFEYKIKFEIDNRQTEIHWEKETLKINNSEYNRKEEIPLPDNILVYYSGHNTRVDESNIQYQLYLKRIIRGGKDPNVNRFIYFDRGYKKLLLSILLAQPFDDALLQKIKSKLNIKDIGNEFIVTLKRPYIVRRNYRIDRGDEKTIYWGLKGEQREFLRRLSTCKNIEDLRESGLIDSQGKKQIYKYYVDLLKFRNEFKYEKVDKLIELFNLIKIIGMIEDIKFEVTLNNGKTQDINDFSDGQFQSIYLFALMESFQDRNCITLLDEPDSFLHPEWQYEFLKQTKDVSIGSVKNNHVLLSSHSPSTIASLKESPINLFRNMNSKIEILKESKKEIIHSLSSGIIKYSEDESSLRIDNVIRSSSKPVLFVEGVTDVTILITAYKKLYNGDDLPVLIQDCFDRGALRQTLSRKEIYNKYPNKIFFGLFDFDDGFTDWNELPGEVINDNISRGFCKKLKEKPAFVFLLPIPDNKLKSQVWDDQNLIERFKGKTSFGIEHIFWTEESVKIYFKEEEFNNEKKIKFKGDKVKFADNVVKNLSPSSFEPFRHMFEFIRNKCANETV